MVDQFLRDANPALQSFAKMLTKGRLAKPQDSAGLTWLELFLLAVSVCPSPDTYTKSTSAHNL
eukprot:4556139-Karenia_brevis.AAC.1